MPEGTGCSSSFPCPGQRRCLCVRVCPRVCVSRRVCPRVSPRVRRACTPARHVCPATCGVCGVCGERSGPGPTCGAGGADTPDTTTPYQSKGWRVSLRYSRREVSAEAIHSDVFIPAAGADRLLFIWFIFALSLPRAPAPGGCVTSKPGLPQNPAAGEGGGITPINTKHAPACQNRDGNLTSFLSNDRALQVIWPGG